MVGAAGAGKSHWAARHWRDVEIVSSDRLRDVVGSGPADLAATDDAFDLLDRIVAARAARRLTTVVDTLGLDADRRHALRDLARRHDLTAAVVVVDTPGATCRARNGARDRPVPATALRSQLRRVAETRESLADEDWDRVLTVSGVGPDAAGGVTEATKTAAAQPTSASGLDGVVLHVSRFPWGEDPQAWLVGVARAAEEAGFTGLALMDHLIQVPQVGRAWEPIPEPLVTLGVLAASTTSLRLGTLVSPVTFRPPGVLAKAMATLDVLSGGRAFCGVGAGWFAREHASHDVAFPRVGARQGALERGIEVMRAVWRPGTKAHHGAMVDLPDTTSYPRPTGDLPIVVGGSGARTLRIAARLGDASNVRTERLDEALPVLRDACQQAGRRLGEEVAVTVLDTPVVGTDRDDVARRVERVRGRLDAATFTSRRAVGTVAHHRTRLATLGERGVATVFLAVGDLEGPDDVERLAPLAGALPG
nr:LLM class flavin-dependent oxidoreductase [Salsipaludibacter albus]